MKYALMILEDPNKAESLDTQALRNFAAKVLGEAEGISKDAMLNPGAFLLPLQNGLFGLTVLLAEAKGHGLRVHTLFFDEKPAFIVT